jgi:hypothetical protein
MSNACPSIRLRLATEVFPELLSQAEIDALRLEIENQPTVKLIVRKQKDSGVWGGNLLGIAANKTTGVKDVGTIPQFRRLVELGLSKDARPQRLASRVLFRLVSRDEDLKLLFEYAKYSTIEIGAEAWIREVLREAAAAALAHGGHGDDPRVRGAAHKILNEVSAFVRGESAEDPFVRSGRAWILRPGAYPPTIFSVTLLAFLPAVQRERAGLVERLGSYLSSAPPKKAFSVPLGKKSLKPAFLLLGDPVHVSASGQPDDLPFALYWMETLARLGLLATSTSCAKVWGRLRKECDASGVWHPHNLRTAPRTTSPWAYHMFPLDSDSKKIEARQTDVTFRMALIARLAGWELKSS